MDFELMIDSMPRLATGAALTLQMVVVSLLVAGPFAFCLALARMSSSPLLRWPAFVYIYVFRGTPFVVQVFFFYYGLGQVEWLQQSVWLAPYFKDAYYYGLLALIANTLAYQAEIFRGGIQSIPHGETEAGLACGMSGWRLYRRIIIPGALRKVLPAYGNEAILLLKASAVVSMVTVQDLMGVAERINARYFAPIEMYLSAAVFYLAMAIFVTYAMRAFEYSLTPHLRANVAHNKGGIAMLSLGR